MAASAEHLEEIAVGPGGQWRLSRWTKKQKLGALALGLIILLGAFLRFCQLGAYSIGNPYYAAAVKSMLTSWKNFFFVSFEPGGSVTVDKPPLGLWVQAVSAYFLGVNGFALALPQALAGVLSLPLLYVLVKRYFGIVAGLAAAFVLAVMPVAVSTERNNTMDGLLVFVLLLAAWAFVRAVESGRWSFLLLGAFLVGLGFNIKMLQAFMPLPAFYALYLFGAKHSWGKRILHLALATVVLMVVSLSWAVAVDLVPAEERPYIGSSENNTVMELIVGHNGLRRLGLDRLLASSDVGGGGGGGLSAAPAGVGQPSGDQGGSVPQKRPPQQGGGPGMPPPVPSSGQVPQNRPPQQGSGPGTLPPGGGPVGGSNLAGRQPDGRNQEVGRAGTLRLFVEPLVTEGSWLLPLALLSLPLALVVLGRPWPLSEKHLALVLWAGWLLPEMLYFSFTTGLFHAYYLIMLGPPLAALVGAGVWALGQLWQRRRWLGWTMLVVLTGVTVLFQIITVQSYPAYTLGITVTAGLAWLAGVVLLTLEPRAWMGKAALALVCIGVLVAPLTWSALTTLNVNPNVALPRAGPDTGNSSGPRASSTLLSSSQQALLDYLLANTEPGSYLVATISAMEAAPYVLSTDRPVLTFGGFNGGDDVISVEELAQMVADGELRFVLGQGLEQRKPEIAAWLEHSCSVIDVPGVETATTGRSPGPGGQGNVLYDCGSY